MRYVVLYRGDGSSESDIELIRQAEGVEILDSLLDRLVLVEADSVGLSFLENRMLDWSVREERVYQPQSLSTDFDG